MMKINIFKFRDTKSLVSFLLERFFIGLLIGGITLGFTIFTKNYLLEYTADINMAVIVSLLVFVLFIAKDAHVIYELRDRMEKADKIYKDVLNGHNKLPNDYSKFMDKTILNGTYKNGIAMLDINDGRYKNLLEDCSKNLQKSYYASFTVPYTIGNIFGESKDKNYMDVSEIIIFLKNMNQKLSSTKNKKRVFIFDKEKFISDIEKVDEKDYQNLIELFKAQNSFDLFFIDKTKLKEDTKLYSSFESILDADFAVFDEVLAFRRTDKQELCFYFLNDLPTNFKSVYLNETFKYNPGVFFQLLKTKGTIKGFDNDIDFNSKRNDLVKSLKIDLKIT